MVNDVASRPVVGRHTTELIAAGSANVALCAVLLAVVAVSDGTGTAAWIAFVFTVTSRWFPARSEISAKYTTPYALL